MRIVNIALLPTLEQEGITDWILECVDLDIAHTPVIPIPGDDTRYTAEAIKTIGGRYLLNPPCSLYPHGYALSADELKVMRARYLLRLSLF